MDELLAFLKGPLATFVVVIFVLGLARRALLSVWALVEAAEKAGDRNVPYATVLRNVGVCTSASS
jgi:hypothetical protein